MKTNKDLVTCAFCGRGANRDFSIPPDKDTPPEDIRVTVKGDRSISFYCVNPDKHERPKFTIYSRSDSEAHAMELKYGLKKNQE